MYEKDATRYSDGGPIRKEGRKSFITFGNARITKGKKKKNRSIFTVTKTIIVENSKMERTPKNENPGYENIGEPTEENMHTMLNRYSNEIKIKLNPYRSMLFTRFA